MFVKNLTSSKSGRAVANQFVITNGNEKTFQSYDTIICEYIDKRCLGFDSVLRVSESYNYSRTTNKYFKQFLNETGLDAEACLRALKADRAYFESHNKDVALVVFDKL